jgi:RimJ/RimL family protein N-acetyltransferase
LACEGLILRKSKKIAQNTFSLDFLCVTSSADVSVPPVAATGAHRVPAPPSHLWYREGLLMADSLRAAIADTLTDTPADALTRYFALEHDPRRVKLFARQNARGKVFAFVAVCQTGIDLFRPFVALRGEDGTAVRELLRESLAPNRSYLFSIQPKLRPDLEAECAVNNAEQNRIYTLSRADFRPIMNLMTQTSRTPDGLFRAVVRGQQDVIAAEAGVSWISSRYAEIFVRVEPSVRGRGLGKSVVSAVAHMALDAGRIPLYMTAEDNTASQKLAERLGFVNTGGHEVSGNLVLKTKV